MAGFALIETKTPLAGHTGLHFLHFPPETAGGVAMPYFEYLASHKESNMVNPCRPQSKQLKQKIKLKYCHASLPSET